jgi:hypothetical protein
MGPEEFAQQIAMYHGEGMGFGVLVKLFSMVEASVEKCVIQLAGESEATNQDAGDVVVPNELTCEALTVEQLVSEFKGGSGLGQLFKEYGKPALLGVGHVKKALKNQPQVTPTPALTTTPEPVVTTTPEPSVGSADLQNQNQKSNNGNGNGNGKSNKPVKVKTPNPHGRNK